MNYTELTGQESGIFIYKESNQAIICNWASDNTADCRPTVFLEKLVWMPVEEDINWELITTGATLDGWMDDCSIIYDENGDSYNTDWSSVQGKFYESDKYMIIAPEGWN